MTNDRCPNCLCGPEWADHLPHCYNPGCSALFDDNMDKLHCWMVEKGRTEDELAFWLHKYLLLQGTVTLSAMGEMSPQMQEVALAIDNRLPLALKQLQQTHCALTGSDSANKWMMQFIRQILDIGHGQWLFRNFALRNTTNGYLMLQRQERTLTEMVRLAECNPMDVPEESRFLLEIDAMQLDNYTTMQKEYCVAALISILLPPRLRLHFF